MSLNLVIVIVVVLVVVGNFSFSGFEHSAFGALCLRGTLPSGHSSFGALCLRGTLPFRGLCPLWDSARRGTLPFGALCPSGHSALVLEGVSNFR